MIQLYHLLKHLADSLLLACSQTLALHFPGEESKASANWRQNSSSSTCLFPRTSLEGPVFEAVLNQVCFFFKLDALYDDQVHAIR